MLATALLAVVALPVAQAHPHYRTETEVGSGVPHTEVRSVSTFHEVASAVPFPVRITMDGREQVTVTCDDNLVPLLETEVRGGELRLEIADGYHNLRPKADCRIEISAGHLEAVSLAGSGDVSVRGEAVGLSELSVAGSGDLTVEAARADSIEASVAGSGDIVAAGAATRIEIGIAGSGNVDLSAVPCEQVTVHIAGSGNVAVAPRERVEVNIVGSGDVELIGNTAKIERNVVGSGRVRVREEPGG